MTTTPPGWYPDERGEQRYWDGERWTSQVAPSQPEAVASAVVIEAVVEREEPQQTAPGAQQQNGGQHETQYSAPQPYAAPQQYGAVQPYGQSQQYGHQAQQFSPAPQQAYAPGYGAPYNGYAVQNNSAATAGFILGLLSFVLTPIVLIPFLGWLVYLALCVTGLVFSIIGLSRASTLGRGTGLAVTGLILSIL